MKLIIGSDHFGLPLKEAIKEYLQVEGYDLTDIGTEEKDPVDYPDIAEKLAKMVAKGDFDRGILICGTGVGMSIVANKIHGIRAASVQDIYSAERAAKSNDANVITFGSQVLGVETAKMLVDAYLHSSFAGGRSTRKVDKIRRVDDENRKEPS